MFNVQCMHSNTHCAIYLYFPLAQNRSNSKGGEGLWFNLWSVFFLLGCKFRVLTGTQIYVFDIRNQLANVKNNMYPTRSLSQVELNKILKWYTRKGIYIEYFLIFGVNRKYTKIQSYSVKLMIFLFTCRWYQGPKWL